MNRRQMIGRSLSAVAVMSMPFPALVRGAGRADEAVTRYGKVRGKREDGIVKFLGVPYATPPLGELRFKGPKPLRSWSGMRDAVSFPNPAFQVAGNEMGPTGNGRMPAPSEDCLYLNIWTPAADCKRRPVMFYTLGGPRPTARLRCLRRWQRHPAATVRRGRRAVLGRQAADVRHLPR